MDVERGGSAGHNEAEHGGENERREVWQKRNIFSLHGVYGPISRPFELRYCRARVWLLAVVILPICLSLTRLLTDGDESRRDFSVGSFTVCLSLLFNFTASLLLLCFDSGLDDLLSVKHA